MAKFRHHPHNLFDPRDDDEPPPRDDADPMDATITIDATTRNEVQDAGARHAARVRGLIERGH